MINKIFNDNCLEAMKNIRDNSIDMILCDLPYGTTEAKWDELINFKLLWKEYERILTNIGSIALHCVQPFTSLLVTSNLKLFNHNIVWHKDKSANFLSARYRPLKRTEDIIIFSKGSFVHNAKYKCTYNSQLIKGTVSTRISNGEEMSNNLKSLKPRKTYTKLTNGNHKNSDEYYATNLIYFKTEHYNRLHPTQKPVKLLEYLIKTYSNENEIVLDNCMGSGSTIIAAINTNRKYIGIEKDDKYFKIAENRINNHISL